MTFVYHTQHSQCVHIETVCACAYAVCMWVCVCVCVSVVVERARQCTFHSAHRISTVLVFGEHNQNHYDKLNMKEKEKINLLNERRKMAVVAGRCQAIDDVYIYMLPPFSASGRDHFALATIRSVIYSS